MHLPHPLGVTLGEVIVDGDHVHTVAGQRVQVHGEGGNEGFTFTGLHLGDTALVQNDTADQLHVKCTLPEGTLRCLSYRGKCLHQNIVQRLAFGKALFELVRLGAELFVRQFFPLRLQRLNLIHNGPDPLQLMLAVRSENLLNQFH